MLVTNRVQALKEKSKNDPWVWHKMNKACRVSELEREGKVPSPN